MRRLARHLFTLCSAVSLLLCVGTCVFSWRGYRSVDELQVGYVWYAQSGDYDARRFVMSSYTHTMAFALHRYDARTSFQRQMSGGVPSFRKDHPSGTRFEVKRGVSMWPRLASEMGFGAVHEDHNGSGLHWGYWKLSVRPWLPVILLAVAPILWVRNQLRVFRARHANRIGLCPTCGYDLRASPDRCPECGTPAAK
jgi:hypothetical protein